MNIGNVILWCPFGKQLYKENLGIIIKIEHGIVETLVHVKWIFPQNNQIRSIVRLKNCIFFEK